eukprot:4784170-Pleurochrysis_carterae.AAC.10
MTPRCTQYRDGAFSEPAVKGRRTSKPSSRAGVESIGEGNLSSTVLLERGSSIHGNFCPVSC